MDRVYAALIQNIPNVKIHSCTRIENINDKGVFELGEIIAHEIRFFVELEIEKGNFNKASFVGFSFGGLVLRAAFQHLNDIKQHFYSFVTLASPHFGSFYSESKLLRMGMWAMTHFSQCPIVSELTLNDNSDIKEKAIVKLSDVEGLDWFENILLIGSFQDNYSLPESSLIQITPRIFNNKHYFSLKKMCDNIHSRIANAHVYKVCVSMKISETSLDTIIGRKAHMQFLENYYLIKLIINNYSEVFRI